MGAAVSSVDSKVVEELAQMGLVHQLAVILEEPLVVTHEHVLNALLTLVERSETARTDARQAPELERRLSDKLLEAKSKPEFSESVEHMERILGLCFISHPEEADR